MQDLQEWNGREIIDQMPPSWSINSVTPSSRHTAPRGGQATARGERIGVAESRSGRKRISRLPMPDGRARRRLSRELCSCASISGTEIVRLRGMGGPFFPFTPAPGSPVYSGAYTPHRWRAIISPRRDVDAAGCPTSKQTKKRCLPRRQFAYLPAPIAGYSSPAPSPPSQAQAELSGSRPLFRCSY